MIGMAKFYTSQRAWAKTKQNYLCCLISGSKFLLTLFVLVIYLGSPSYAASEDSDGDGLTDSYEESLGLEPYLSDTDGDTIKDGAEIGQSHESPLDTDSDGIIDALDDDDDGDGLPTYLESKIDSDQDGKLGYLDKDSDNDGVTDGEEAGALNLDDNNDGVDDAFDVSGVGSVDLNGDGIDDNIKLPDHDNDGNPDFLESSYQNAKTLVANKLDEKMQVEIVENNKEKKSGNTEIITEMLAAENSVKESVSENKIEEVKVVEELVAEIPEKKELEKEIQEPEIVMKRVVPEEVLVNEEKVVQSVATVPKDMIVNRKTDSDNDGLSNSLEKKLGTNHLSRDSDGDRVSDAIEIGLDINTPQDSDRDGVIDALDEDDDNDGILTKFEDVNKDSTAINDDTDQDGVPNYLDANDDGDEYLTRVESATFDTDGDGILDYLDHDDGVGQQLAKLKEENTSKIEESFNKKEVIVLFDGEKLLTEKSSDDSKIAVSDVLQDDIVKSLSELVLSENVIQSESFESDDVNNILNKNQLVSKTKSWDLF